MIVLGRVLPAVGIGCPHPDAGDDIFSLELCRERGLELVQLDEA